MIHHAQQAFVSRLLAACFVAGSNGIDSSRWYSREGTKNGVARQFDERVMAAKRDEL